jgi:hypothetical protein
MAQTFNTRRYVGDDERSGSEMAQCDLEEKYSNAFVLLGFIVLKGQRFKR